ncbi:hypothetical protein HDE_12814 [Halotydeus destructor]|nr:hypothetical protein HDE_12814 [Halotydeus destructor]
MASNASLDTLDDRIVKKVLYFARYIWDVLHFTATSQRFHAVAEEHLKTLEYPDIRLPFQLGSPQAEAIKHGMKTLIEDRIGQLTKVHILKPYHWLRESNLFASFKLISEAVKRAFLEGKDSALIKLMMEFVATCMNQQNYIELDGLGVMRDLMPLLRVSDRSLSWGIYYTLSAVNRIEVHVDSDLDPNLLIVGSMMFPKLKVIGLDVKGFDRLLSPECIPALIHLLETFDDLIKLRLGYFEFLANPAFATGLKDHLSKLYIDLDDEHACFPSPFTLASYEQLEAELAVVDGPDKEAFLSAICRVKRIATWKLHLEDAKELIGYRSRDTEKLDIVLRDVVEAEADELFQCVVESCPNLTQLKLNIEGSLDDAITALIEKIGSSLRVIRFIYDQDSLPKVVSVIVTHCPNLERLELKGRAYQVEAIKMFYSAFRRMPNLDKVLFQSSMCCGSHVQVTLVYCNDKMALDGPDFSDFDPNHTCQGDPVISCIATGAGVDVDDIQSYQIYEDV